MEPKVTTTITKRDFLIAMLGTQVIAVLPKQPSLAGAAPVLDPFAVAAPEGWTYQWVRSSLMGEPDPYNVQQRLDNGWTFVPADRHPAAELHDLGEAVKHYGLILMQKETALIEQPKPLAMPGVDVIWPTSEGSIRGSGGLPRPYKPDEWTFVGSSCDKPDA